MGRRNKGFLRNLLSIVMLTLISGINATAQVPTIETECPPLPREWRVQPRHSLMTRVAHPGGSIGDQRTAATVQWLDVPTLPDIYRDCTQIAFQSWVEGNWEIYVARGDGSNPTRLTQNSDWDETPSLSRDCEFIAFGTDRSGNDDIYVMRSDGSEVRRITLDPAPDVLPSFSPDATHIAFQSYRDGDEPEIYVIDTTDRSTIRLTHNDCYDAEPAWSPGGRHIAFVSDRSGTKNVWVMDADGANPRQVTTLPHAGGPKWSPDGRRIALASDDLSTGFSALWVVNADGTGAHLVWRPASALTDAWPGGWSFDGTYILYEEATWVSYGDEWYILNAYLDVIDPDDLSERYRLVGVGVNMSASWATCDKAPPTSWVHPLPGTSTPPTALHWSGSDDCATQIEYQLQYRRGGEGWSWTDWPVTPGSLWTTKTQGEFAWDDPGALVYFRCRARDPIGNVESWPTGQGDTRTSYPAHLSGFVGDCRDVPVADAELSGPPPLRTSARSDIKGHYLLPVSGEGEYTLGVRAEGYEPLQLQRPDLDDVSGLDYALTTTPDLVQNGGFESGPAAWYATGGTSFLRGDLAYGARYVQLGDTGASSGGYAPLTTRQAPEIWQPLDLPASVHRPTLSFMYALGASGDGAVGRLEAIIREGQQETVVVSLAAPTPWLDATGGGRYPLWRHAYADLSPWAGRSITLSFRYDVGWTNSAALLDQVSIAPWLTPQVSAVIPNQTAPGQAVTVTILGKNFMAARPEGWQPKGIAPTPAQVSIGSLALTTTLVNSTTLRAIVPFTLPIGAYDVWVRNPSGQRSALVKGFVVGGSVDIPLVWK